MMESPLHAYFATLAISSDEFTLVGDNARVPAPVKTPTQKKNGSVSINRPSRWDTNCEHNVESKNHSPLAPVRRKPSCDFSQPIKMEVKNMRASKKNEAFTFQKRSRNTTNMFLPTLLFDDQARVIPRKKSKNVSLFIKQALDEVNLINCQ